MRSQCLSKFLLLFVAILPVASCFQSTFRYPLEKDSFDYELEWPVKRVAVIGAGVGGMNAYRELKKEGFDVHIFERDHLPGGVWHYTEEVPLDAPVPNAPIEISDFESSLPPRGVGLPYSEEYKNKTMGAFLRRIHRSPKPVWYHMMTNSPAPVSQIRGFPWPEDTEWTIPRAEVGRYLRAYASWHGINSNDNSSDISYNTRIELVEKRLDSEGKHIGWTLTSKHLEELNGGSSLATWNKEDFDAVVIASGRYNAPNMPSIEGLEQWRRKFNDNILHSRQYRHPEDYSGKTILIVGAAASGSQISRELSVAVAKIYQSVRPDSVTERPTLVDWIRRIPRNVSVIAEIRRFQPPAATIQESGIELTDGTILYGIDHIIFATGFRYTYPFLPNYHNPALGRKGEAPADVLQPIVTDGSHIRSLHLDTFYIDNPTLAFVNCNLGISTFTYSEFQSFAISMVWAGKAHLPNGEEMWRLYREKVETIGYGNHFSFLGSREELMRRFFQGWLNAAAAKYGGRLIEGISFEMHQILTLWNRAQFGDPWLIRDVTIPGAENLYSNPAAFIGEGPIYGSSYDDYW